jgi:hypothetical protein
MNEELYTKFDDAQERLDYWLQKSKERPVMIMWDKKVLGVIVSHEEYLRFTRGDRKIVVHSELTQDEIDALAREKPFLPPGGK